MTDETLAAFAATAPERIDCELWTLLDWSLWGAGLADTLRFPMASTMVAAVPAEVRAQAEAVMAAWLKFRGVESPSRTNAELRADLERSRSECAVLTAKVEAAEAKAAEWDLTDEQIEMIAADISPLRRAEKWLKLTSYRVCAQALRSALNEASGMPHTPAQEDREHRCPNCDRWALWTDGELAEDNDGVALFWCQNCSAEMRLDSMESRPVPQMPRNPAEINGDGLTDAERGTGVREPHTRPQGSLPVEEGP